MVSSTVFIPAVLASLVSAIPAPSTLPTGGSTLPLTLELFVYQGSTQIGCINGYGNFTADLQWCLPFNTGADTDGSGYASLRGYDACSATSVLDCYETTAAVDTQFYEINGDLAIGDTNSGSTFSVNSIPASDDTVGVPLLVGSGGSIQVALQVKAVSG